MAHNVKVFAVAPTDGVSTLTSAQLVALDLNGYGAVSGDNGGAWAPSASIDIGGAGINPTLKAATWPNFAADGGAIRTFVRAMLAAPAAYVSYAAQTASGIIVGNGAGGNFDREIGSLLPDGATLTSIVFRAAILNSHASLPTTFPRMSVYRVALATLATVRLAAADLGNGEACIISAGTFGAYNALGNASATYTCNQNNVIDRTQYAYFVHVIDENGGGAAVGNQFVGFVTTHTATDSRPA